MFPLSQYFTSEARAVRGLSPKASYAYEREYDHYGTDSLSVCKLRIRLFERGVTKRKQARVDRNFLWVLSAKIFSGTSQARWISSEARFDRRSSALRLPARIVSNRFYKAFHGDKHLRSLCFCSCRPQLSIHSHHTRNTYIMSGLFGNAATSAAANNTTGDISKDVALSNPPEDGISDLSFSPQSEHLAIASWDKKVRIYEINAQGGSEGKALFEHEGPVLSCCWSKVCFVSCMSEDPTS